MSNALAAVAPSDLVLGRYRPVRPLGSGGSGSVWLARDERTGIEVALKIVPREGKAASRAEREAAAGARLRHERCLRAYAFAHDDSHVYIAYEYAPGRTVREALRAGELDDASAVEAAAQTLEGLAHAHAHGILHRDVKPSNVLLVEGTGDISVRLLDFGLARIQEAETLTAVGDVPGTLAYIAPERLGGEQASEGSDVWGVGVMLWEALAGYHPFWRASLLETARAIEEGAPSLAKPRPDLPKGLVLAVDRALALAPSRRPSAQGLALRLRGAMLERDARRRRKRGRGGELVLPHGAERLLPAALAGVFAGWSAWALPFYPAGFAPGLALVAALLTLASERAALAFALAVPVLPLGNVSSGLAWVYGALALAWLALSWGEPRSGLVAAAGPLAAPLGALGLLPLAGFALRSTVRRGLQVACGVLLAGVVAGIRHAPLPFTGGSPPRGLGIAGSDRPLAVAEELARALAAHPALGIEALVLGAAAAVLPLATRRGLWGIALFGAALLAAALVPPLGVAALPLVACTWVICIGLGVRAAT